ncbi:hypothetical protein Tcan_00257 [Toxocara canis]|uniref:Uncharacterized protein n=1 Tax=Toxocara canis TaxID=6265 RepID=A0A0B2UZ84_TOXCA|nr:hypothetical protein Tcan_00257 [Toxocara canis]
MGWEEGGRGRGEEEKWRNSSDRNSRSITAKRQRTFECFTATLIDCVYSREKTKGKALSKYSSLAEIIDGASLFTNTIFSVFVEVVQVQEIPLQAENRAPVTPIRDGRANHQNA